MSITHLFMVNIVNFINTIKTHSLHLNDFTISKGLAHVIVFLLSGADV